MATAVDQDSDADGWLYIDSDNPADSSGDDAGVLALSSACTTPDCCSDDDNESIGVVIAPTCLRRRCARSPSTDDAAAGLIALSSACTTPDCCSDDDDESLGVVIAPTSSTLLRHRYARSPSPPLPSPDDDDDADDVVDALYGLALEEEYGDHQPPPPVDSRPLSGLFHHRIDGGVDYTAFDPVPGSIDMKVLVPDPAFSACKEEVTVLASNGGLVCLRANNANLYIVANPATFKHVRLPRHSCDHRAYGDPAVVITFEENITRTCCADHRGHYHVVVAFPLEGGIYAYESFSSRTWRWTAGAEVSPVERVDAASGVGALGRAFWRTALGYFLSYDPLSGAATLIPAPLEVLHWPTWELGEMDGTLAVTCMDERVNDVIVIKFLRELERDDDDDGGGAPYYGSRTTIVEWSLATHFEGGCMRNRQGVQLMRSQGHEVVMWYPFLEIAVAMDNEGRTTRTIGPLTDRRYYSDFIPYVASSTGVTRIQAEAECKFDAANADDA